MQSVLPNGASTFAISSIFDGFFITFSFAANNIRRFPATTRVLKGCEIDLTEIFI